MNSDAPEDFGGPSLGKALDRHHAGSETMIDACMQETSR